MIINMKLSSNFFMQIHKDFKWLIWFFLLILMYCCSMQAQSATISEGTKPYTAIEPTSPQSIVSPQTSISKSTFSVTSEQGSFQCTTSNKNISISLRCNNRDDCSRNESRSDSDSNVIDVSDEINCELCQKNLFHCNNNICIPESERCDLTSNCVDSSDEIDCHCPPATEGNPCNNEWLYCRNGSCYHERNACDGISHCSDNTDEENCLLNGPNIENYSSLIEARDLIPVFHVHYCDSEHSRYIDHKFICDGFSDCENNWDEAGCIHHRKNPCNKTTKECSEKGKSSEMESTHCNGENLFLCLDGGCIPMNFRCDNRNHCMDGSDEIGCPSVIKNYNAECPFTRTEKELAACQTDLSLFKYIFVCSSNSSIDARQICDGCNDCPGGEDENRCASIRNNQHDDLSTITLASNTTCFNTTCINTTPVIYNDHWFIPFVVTAITTTLASGYIIYKCLFRRSAAETKITRREGDDPFDGDDGPGDDFRTTHSFASSFASLPVAGSMLLDMVEVLPTTMKQSDYLKTPSPTGLPTIKESTATPPSANAQLIVEASASTSFEEDEAIEPEPSNSAPLDNNVSWPLLADYNTDEVSPKSYHLTTEEWPSVPEGNEESTNEESTNEEVERIPLILHESEPTQADRLERSQLPSWLTKQDEHVFLANQQEGKNRQPLAPASRVTPGLNTITVSVHSSDNPDSTEASQ